MSKKLSVGCCSHSLSCCKNCFALSRSRHAISSAHLTSIQTNCAAFFRGWNVKGTDKLWHNSLFGTVICQDSSASLNSDGWTWSARSSMASLWRIGSWRRRTWKPLSRRSRIDSFYSISQACLWKCVQRCSTALTKLICYTIRQI